MGIYLNPENVDFQKSLNSEIYIDKTELIAYTNKKLNTEQCHSFEYARLLDRIGKYEATDSICRG